MFTGDFLPAKTDVFGSSPISHPKIYMKSLTSYGFQAFFCYPSVFWAKTKGQ